MRVTTILLSAGVLLLPLHARAQVLLAPEPQPANQEIACGKHPNPATPLTDLRDHYTSGRWDHLLARTKALLDTCAFLNETADPALFNTSPQGAKTPNYTRDWYLVVLATVDADDQPLVIRYVLHDPLPYPYANNTLGVPFEPRDEKGSKINDQKTSRLVQVFLAANKAVKLETKIQVTETANPLEGQIADVVKAVLDPSVIVPLLKGIIPPSTRGGAAPGPTEGPVFASVSRVYPPFDSGDYKYSDVLRAPAMLDADKSLLLRDKFATQAEAVKGTPDEVNLAKALAAAADKYLVAQQSAACSPAKYDESCWTGLESTLRAEHRTFCVGNKSCQGDRDDLMLLRFIETAKPPKGTTATISTTISSIPYSRFSFGMLGAYVMGASASKDRVKVDGGKVVADPLGRALTAVVLNVHGRFNPKAPEMENSEKWRAFVGAVITPNLGMTIGGGYGFMRNLSLNVGYALLIIPTMREGDQLDTPPSDGKQPFASGYAHVAFAGFGYKFGK